MDFVEQVYEPVCSGFCKLLQNTILIEYNAHIHTANYARKWRSKAGFKNLKWLQQSSDLNLIEISGTK